MLRLCGFRGIQGASLGASSTYNIAYIHNLIVVSEISDPETHDRGLSYMTST